MKLVESQAKCPISDIYMNGGFKDCYFEMFQFDPWGNDPI